MIADLFTAARRRNAVTADSPGVVMVGSGTSMGAPDAERAQTLSAFYRAVDLLSGDMAVLPAYVMDTASREHMDHPILRLLSQRPNEAMTPSVRKYLLRRSVLLDGNAYDWIVRDPRSGVPLELLPIPGRFVTVWRDRYRRPWYRVQLPDSGEVFTLPGEDVCHYKGPSPDGLVGRSLLGYASETLAAGLAAQKHNRTYYESGGQPSGILTLEADYSGYIRDKDGNLTDMTRKEKIRREWEATHSGPTNAHRIAVLDNGMKYQSLGMNHRDSQFIEQQGLTVEDIARFTGVPLYKLMSGKQSYNSNEQNAIEYVQGLQPYVTQCEEEQTYKLLSLTDRGRGLEIRYNMMALLRGDSKSRAEYYRTMRDIGAYSVNDILHLEDLPDVEGGEHRFASLNYVPLALWADLSVKRNTQPAADS